MLTTLTYSAEKFHGRPSGNVSRVFYLLRFPAAEQPLANIVFDQVSPGPQQLASRGKISFKVLRSPNYRMAPLAVLFLDGEMRVLGTFEASILSPIR